MNYLWHDIVGNLGVVVIIGTYFCVQVSLMDVKRWTYSLLNAVGSLLVIVSLFFEFNLSAFAIEVAWLLVSCLGLLRLTLGALSAKSTDPEQTNA